MGSPFRAPLRGELVPFGHAVYFLPSPTKYSASKMAPRMQPGIFLGYRLAPGGRWNGEYLAVDLSDFTGHDLHVDADGYDARVTPRITKQVRVESPHRVARQGEC